MRGMVTFGVVVAFAFVSPAGFAKNDGQYPKPTRRLEQMKKRRGADRSTALCSGPGKLTEALGISGSDHLRDLCSGTVRRFRPRDRPVELVTDRRIGITRAAELPWRFLERDSLFVSVKPRVGLGGASS